MRENNLDFSKLVDITKLGQLKHHPNALLRKAFKAVATSGRQKVTKKRDIAMGTFQNPGSHGAYSGAPFRGVQVAGTGVPQGPAK